MNFVEHAFKLLDKHPRDVKKATVIAIIVRRNKILSYGFNKRKLLSHDGIMSYHAEENAIRKSKTSLRNSTMYVIRVKKDNTLGDAKPCRRCTKMIEKVGIGKVIFTK